MTIEELFRKYSATYRSRDAVFNYLMSQLEFPARPSTRFDDKSKIIDVMLHLINSRILFLKLSEFTIKDIKQEMSQTFISRTLAELAKKHYDIKIPFYTLINKGVPLIYKSCSDDEGDECTLEEDTKFVVINGVHKKLNEEEEEGGYYLK